MNGLECVGNVITMDQTRVAKRSFDGIPQDRRKTG
jgi:hypothetical protein